MANFVNAESLTYAGKEGQEIFSKDILDLDLRGYGITYMDGVKSKQKLYTGEVGDLWQAYTCPFSPNGSVNLSESYIEPAAIKVNLEQCYDAFWPTFMVEQTEISLNGGVPQTFNDWFFNQKLRPQMAKEYQEIFFKGDKKYTGTTKQYLKVVDGVEKQLNDATGATKIKGEALTVDNAIAQVEAVVMKGVDNAAKADVDTSDYKIFMNYADVNLLRIALGKLMNGNSTTDVFSNYSKDGDKIGFDGFEIVPTMQSRGVIIFGPAKNLVLGYDTFDSHIEYRVIDMKETTGDNEFRVIAISNIAVGIVLPELFVISKA